MTSLVSTLGSVAVCQAWGQVFPVFAIRLLRENKQAEGTSIALIFVDARQAFHAIVRKLVLSVFETDQAVASLLNN